MKRILLFASLAFVSLVGCRNEMPSAPAQTTPLEGTWNYISTDGQDFSDYGITYSFNGDQWKYTLGDAGSKVYRIAATADNLTATLIADGMHSTDALGSVVTSSFAVHGDTLTMQTSGHTAILTRQ